MGWSPAPPGEPVVGPEQTFGPWPLRAPSARHAVVPPLGDPPDGLPPSAGQAKPSAGREGRVSLSPVTWQVASPSHLDLGRRVCTPTVCPVPGWRPGCPSWQSHRHASPGAMRGDQLQPQETACPQMPQMPAPRFLCPSGAQGGGVSTTPALQGRWESHTAAKSMRSLPDRAAGSGSWGRAEPSAVLWGPPGPSQRAVDKRQHGRGWVLGSASRSEVRPLQRCPQPCASGGQENPRAG